MSKFIHRVIRKLFVKTYKVEVRVMNKNIGLITSNFLNATEIFNNTIYYTYTIKAYTKRQANTLAIEKAKNDVDFTVIQNKTVKSQ